MARRERCRALMSLRAAAYVADAAGCGVVGARSVCVAMSASLPRRAILRAER